MIESESQSFYCVIFFAWSKIKSFSILPADKPDHLALTIESAMLGRFERQVWPPAPFNTLSRDKIDT